MAEHRCNRTAEVLARSLPKIGRNELAADVYVTTSYKEARVS